MSGLDLQTVLAVSIIIAILVLVYGLAKPAPLLVGSCSAPGAYACPDPWASNNLIVSTRQCGDDYAWALPASGGVGPSACDVKCSPGYFPCWDDDLKAGACKQGTDASSCKVQCSPTAGSPNACQNGGRCSATRGKCTCPLGYTGFLCEKNLTDPGVCDGSAGAKNRCLNGGTCEDSGACTCPEGFYPPYCNPGKCNVDTCNKNSSGTYRIACADPDGPTPFDCKCPTGTYPTWGPSPCGISNCVSDNDCANSGTCDQTNHVCNCKPGYYGPLCDSEGVCDLALCRANGVTDAYCSDPDGPNPYSCGCGPNGASVPENPLTCYTTVAPQ